MYRGTIVPLVTPLEENGAVCERSVRRLINSVRDQVTALMPALSTGEGWKLSEHQWQKMVTYIRKYAEGLPVLAGIQLKETADVIARARVAMGFGVDAVVVMPPFRDNASQDEIYEHYRKFRSAVTVHSLCTTRQLSPATISSFRRCFASAACRTW
jgi:4-hydroxy-tetrahydrodipicolinate synthase